MSLLRSRWFAPVVIVIAVVGAFGATFLFRADSDEVVRRLEQQYGAQEIVWQGNGRYQRDTLVVDGRDLTEHCVVTGEWGPLDDLAIECDGEVDPPVPADRP